MQNRWSRGEERETKACFRGKKIISSTVFYHEIKITDLRFFEERDE